jgi:glycosyltransferase involved in cell wall biosynthesis
MQSRLPLSVAIITLNEEANLPRCLESVRTLAAEIVVVDAGSQDGTERVARAAGAKFCVQPWQGHVTQKNLALAACSQPWVLSLDADEAVSPELAVSLRELFAGHPPVAAGYAINRRTFYLGHWVRHAWQPEWRLRLVRREKAQWRGRDPHDRLEVAGATAPLRGDLLHYSYKDLSDHFQRTIRHARTSADSLERLGQRCGWYHLVISPWLALGKRLILKQGFRDGRRGWIIAYTTFFSVLAKYAFRFEKQLAQGAQGAPVARQGDPADARPRRLP